MTVIICAPLRCSGELQQELQEQVLTEQKRTVLAELYDCVAKCSHSSRVHVNKFVCVAECNGHQSQQ
jgi:hypothetical protein